MEKLKSADVNKLRLPKVIPNASNGYSIPKIRPLVLVSGNVIRLAEIPVNSSFKILRELVLKFFPWLKGVLINFIDSDGDLVTITCSSELRLAESEIDEKQADSTFSMLRLHIIEVNPEQEPPLLEDDEPEQKVDFVGIFSTLCGYNPESVMETVTNEEALTLFHKAASKFEEDSVFFFLKLGNRFMCQAQNRMKKIDEAGMDEHRKKAYDWVREKYEEAERKYNNALLLKPDFFEGLLALGQLQFERAKLLWSFVLAQKSDLSKWDPTKMILLFESAEMNMTAATKAWEEMEKKDEAMSSQIHLFWGNMLFTRSHIVCFLGLSGWDTDCDAALKRFKLAGLSDGEKEEVFGKHCCCKHI